MYPDETQALDATLRGQILTPTSFSAPVVANPPTQWPRWEAGKHLVCALAETGADLADIETPRASAIAAVDRLANSVALYDQIRQTGLQLRDSSDAYPGKLAPGALRRACESRRRLRLLGAVVAPGRGTIPGEFVHHPYERRLRTASGVSLKQLDSQRSE